MRKLENVLFGSDAESFVCVENKITKEPVYVTAEHFIKGTKKDPFIMEKTPTGVYMSCLDNVLAEFGIPPIRREKPELWLQAFAHAKELVSKQLPEGHFLKQMPAVIMGDDQLVTEHSRTFGCDPTFCCWTWETNPAPEATDPNLRSSGLHVHIGYDNADVNTTMDLMKYFDLYVGVPATLIEPANKRRELYGKAGECRVKEYGGEYRVLSSYFMSTDPLLEWVFKASNYAVSAFEKEEYDINALEDRITDAISNNNSNEAKALVKEFGLLV